MEKYIFVGAFVALGVSALVGIVIAYYQRKWISKKFRTVIDAYACRDEKDAFWQFRRDYLTYAREFFAAYHRDFECIGAAMSTGEYSALDSFDIDILTRMGFSEESWKNRQMMIYKEGDARVIAFYECSLRSLGNMKEQHELIKLARECASE